MTEWNSACTVIQFQLIVDGCNGPIRFRERNLSSTTCSTTKIAGNTAADTVVGNNNNNNDANNIDHDDEDVILSFLRPGTITILQNDDDYNTGMNNHNNQRSYHSTPIENRKKKKKKNCKSKKKKNKRKAGQSYHTATRRTNNVRNPHNQINTPHTMRNNNEDYPTRLDMLPLFEKLLRHSFPSTSTSTTLFHSVVVLFDGISFTKRRPCPTTTTPSTTNYPSSAISSSRLLI